MTLIVLPLFSVMITLDWFVRRSSGFNGRQRTATFMWLDLVMLPERLLLLSVASDMLVAFAAVQSKISHAIKLCKNFFAGLRVIFRVNISTVSSMRSDQTTMLECAAGCCFKITRKASFSR